MGSLYQRARSACFYASFVEPVWADGRIVREHGQDGRLKVKVRTVNRSTKTALRRRAEALLAEWETSARRDIEAPELAEERERLRRGRAEKEQAQAERLTFKQLRDGWLTARAAKRSIENDRVRFDDVLAYFGEGRTVGSLTLEDLQALERYLLAAPRRRNIRTQDADQARPPLAPMTVKHVFVLLRGAVARAEAEHRARGRELFEGRLSPFETFRLGFKVHNERSRVCTREEFDLLVSRASSPWLKLAITIAYFTGMRAGEIVSLRWSQVNFAERTIQLHSGETKTGKARTVPLARPVVEALEAWPREGEHVFAWKVEGNRKNSRVVVSTLSSNFRALVLQLGIKGLRFHDLRHTALTRLAEAGVDLLTVASISGHASLTMLARYAHHDTARAKLAAVDRAFGE